MQPLGESFRRAQERVARKTGVTLFDARTQIVNARAICEAGQAVVEPVKVPAHDLEAPKFDTTKPTPPKKVRPSVNRMGWRDVGVT